MFMKSSSSLNRFNLDLDVAKRCLFREGVVPRKLEKADFDSGLDIFFFFFILKTWLEQIGIWKVRGLDLFSEKIECRIVTSQTKAENGLSFGTWT